MNINTQIDKFISVYNQNSNIFTEMEFEVVYNSFLRILNYVIDYRRFSLHDVNYTITDQNFIIDFVVENLKFKDSKSIVILPFRIADFTALDMSILRLYNNRLLDITSDIKPGNFKNLEHILNGKSK